MAAIVPGAYFIKNIATGTVIELPGGNPANGTLCEGFSQRSYSDGFVSSQIWVVALVAEDGNIFTIQNARSGTYMNLTNGSTADSTPIVGEASDGGSEQHWTITRTTDGEGFIIQNQASSTFVDLLNGGTSNGTLIQGWHGNGTSTTNPHQRWDLIHA